MRSLTDSEMTQICHELTLGYHNEKCSWPFWRKVHLRGSTKISYAVDRHTRASRRANQQQVEFIDCQHASCLERI